LVVIGIIAILASLLLPAIQSAKEKGKQAYCINNLMQLGVAFTLYSDDYDEHMMPNAALPSGTSYWRWAMDGHLGCSPVLPRNPCLSRAWYCPSYSERYYGYMHNKAYWDTKCKVFEVKHPAQKVLLAEGNSSLSYYYAGRQRDPVRSRFDHVGYNDILLSDYHVESFGILHTTFNGDSSAQPCWSPNL